MTSRTQPHHFLGLTGTSGVSLHNIFLLLLDITIVDQSHVHTFYLKFLADCHINHYYGYWWADLEEKELDSFFSKLGWSKAMWDEGDEGDVPSSDDKYFDELNSDEQAAAQSLCYFRELWDGEELPFDG